MKAYRPVSELETKDGSADPERENQGNESREGVGLPPKLKRDKKDSTRVPARQSIATERAEREVGEKID